MTLELPELLDIDWSNYAERINSIYDVYLMKSMENYRLWKTRSLSYYPIYVTSTNAFGI